MRFSAFANRNLNKMGSLIKSTILTFFILLLLLLFKTPALAQTNGYSLPNIPSAKNLTSITNPGIPNNLNTYSQTVLFSVMSAVGCQLAGIDPVSPKQLCLGMDDKTGKIGYAQNNGGLLGFMSGMIISLYTPPAHTSDYISYLSGNFGIVKNVNAQDVGVGLESIGPIARLWIMFRDIVYLLFVVIFMIIGLGIMLRLKIDPRTVMTIQNQIPKIIIGIILVTLSFPIAGFLIDIMWVSIIVIVNMLKDSVVASGGGGYNYATPFGLTGVLPGGILGVAGGTALHIGNSIFNAGFTGDKVVSLVSLPGAACNDILCFLGNALNAILGAIFGFIIGLVVGLVAFFVVIIALLYALFKLWFELLKAYVSILIDIILAPFWIVAGLIPGAGEKVGFGAWLRDMLGNLMAFPAAVAMFFLAGTFALQFKIPSGVFFLPPLVGPQSAEFGTIIAFGILMMTPNVVKMTKTVFKSAGIGMGINTTGFAMAGALGGAVWGQAYKKNPMTGEHYGPAVNAGKSITRGIAKIPQTRPMLIVRNSPVGKATGKVTNAVVNNPATRGVGKVTSKIVGIFQAPPKQPPTVTTNTPTTNLPPPKP